MTTLPYEYQLARELYALIYANPKISRPEVNRRLRAESDSRKIEAISKVLKHMLAAGQLQKVMNREACQVFFWATEGSTERGDPIRRDLDEPIFNYLIDPPKPAPTPPPTPAPAVVAETIANVPPVVVPLPKPPSDKPLKERVFDVLEAENKPMRADFLAMRLRVPIPTILEEIVELWSERVICKCNFPANTSRVLVWLPSLRTDKVDDPHPDDTPDEEESDDLYMMRDMKNKNRRILLRPTGDTLTLTVQEIEFIKSLKAPFVTL